MFEVDLNEDLVVNWPVKIEVPADGGKKTAFNASVKFRVLDRDELDNIDRDIISKSILGWDFIDASTGEALACNNETKDALLKRAYMERALGIGLVNASLGVAEKNS